jgi:Uma2 family endonuclease
VQLVKRRFTVDEYHRMAEAGILSEDDRVELIHGEIVQMVAIGSRHAACVKRLNGLLMAALGGRAIVSVQDPIRLDAYSEPEPDLAILRPKADFYASAHPSPLDVLFVIEVADSSGGADRTVKVPLYARAGVPEMWLIDMQEKAIDVYTGPSPQGYTSVRRHGSGEGVALSLIEGVSLEVENTLVSNRRCKPQGRRKRVPQWRTVYCRERGSSASRSQSPNTLMANTVAMIARPGKTVSHQALAGYCRFSASVPPHGGVGGCTPSPKKLRPASARII